MKKGGGVTTTNTTTTTTTTTKFETPEEIMFEKCLNDIYVDFEWPWNVKDVSFEAKAYLEDEIYPNLLIEHDAEWFWTRANEKKLENALKKNYHVYWLKFFPGLNRVRMELKERKVHKTQQQQQPSPQRERLI